MPDPGADEGGKAPGAGEPGREQRRGGLRRSVLELLYRLRTEGESPGRRAAAVGVGVFLGCTPFYGLHLALCIVAARLFRLNQILTYLAAHISVPGLWPLLVIAELQVGRRLRGKAALSLTLADVRRLDLWSFAADLLLGSAVVGAVLAALFAWLTWRAATRGGRLSEAERLVDETSRRYVEAGVFAWEFARAKLRHDPMYFALLRGGRLPAEGPLLDLGCGRGLLLALVASARAQAARGHYPAGWPPPPAGPLAGIERNPRRAREARSALQDEARIEVGDLQEAAIPPQSASGVLLLDVLHYLDAGAQEKLLDRVVAALAPGGKLILREADAAAGAAFRRTRAAERLCALGRGHFRQRFHFRSATEWEALLAARGLSVSAVPMSEGTPYANVLIEGALGERMR